MYIYILSYIHSIDQKVCHKENRMWNNSLIYKYTPFLQCKIL